jgi:hypothetical protein
MARLDIQVGDLNSQILRVSLDAASKADMAGQLSEVANMKGHFAELREHVMDAGMGKADEVRTLSIT